MTLVSNFRAAENAAHEVVSASVRTAVLAGRERAAERLDMQASRRDYNLSGADVGSEAHADDGKIFYEPFYGRFFEYGTVHIEAMPFMRPGSRAMRKTFKLMMGANFERWIALKAGMRRRA